MEEALVLLWRRCWFPSDGGGPGSPQMEEALVLLLEEAPVLLLEEAPVLLSWRRPWFSSEVGVHADPVFDELVGDGLSGRKGEGRAAPPEGVHHLQRRTK